MDIGGRLRSGACRGMLVAILATGGTAHARGSDDAFSAAQRKLHKVHTRAFEQAIEQPSAGFDYGRAQAALREAESDLEQFLATAPVLSPDREQAQHDLGAIHQEQRDLKEAASHVRSLPAEAVASSTRTAAQTSTAGQLTSSSSSASAAPSRRTLGWALLGTGAGLGVVAGVLYGVSVHQANEAMNTRQQHAADIETLAHHAAVERSAALPLAIVGIAAVAVGVPLALMGGEGNAPQTHVELGRAQASLNLGWRLP